MLHVQTVQPIVVSLLKRLFALKALQGCSLVGGNALSLGYGHRSSVDLGLFTSGELDRDGVTGALEKEFGRPFA